MRNLPHPAARRLALIAGLGAAAVAFTGCQSIAGAGSTAQLRVIDVSPDAPVLDIYTTSSSKPSPSALYNVGFGTVSSYMQLPSGSWMQAAYTAGTQQQIASLRSSLAPGDQYTLLTGDIAAGLRFTLLQDQSTPAPAGHVALRFLGESTRAGAVDLYLLPAGDSLSNGFAPAAANISLGSNTGYHNLPAGTYSLVALPSGATPGEANPIFTGSETIFPSGSARTILLIDALGRQPPGALASEQTAGPSAVQFVTAEDYNPPAS